MIETTVDLRKVKDLFRQTNRNRHRTLDGARALQSFVLPERSKSQDAHHDVEKQGRLLVGLDIHSLGSALARAGESGPTQRRSDFFRKLLRHRHIASISKRIISPFGNGCKRREIHGCKECAIMLSRCKKKKT